MRFEQIGEVSPYVSQQRSWMLFGGLSVLLLIGPFLAFAVSLLLLFMKNWTFREYKFLFGVIALFGGLLAFTQNTDTGDIYRVYTGIVQNAEGVSSIVAFMLLSAEKYILWAGTNVMIYEWTGNVQFISFFWIFLFYFFLFMGMLNMMEYKGIRIDRRSIGGSVCCILFCFVMFTQITEIMKQSVALSMCFYAYSCFLQHRIKRSLIVFLISLGIHFSQILLLPVLFTRKIGNKTLGFVVVLSFFFRHFNLMDFVYSQLNRLGQFGMMMELADSYRENDADFFQSSAFYFVLSFWFFVIITLGVYRCIRSKDSVLIKSVLMMIAILNLNYANAHNYTRFVTMLFPFYCMLMIELRTPVIDLTRRKIAFGTLVAGSFLLNIYLIPGRLSEDSTYRTSYMDNSIAAIVASSSWGYLNYRFGK